MRCKIIKHWPDSVDGRKCEFMPVMEIRGVIYRRFLFISNVLLDVGDNCDHDAKLIATIPVGGRLEIEAEE